MPLNKARIGEKRSKEWIEKMRQWNKGNKSRLGQHQSAEERLKKSIALKGRPKSPEHNKKVADAQRGKKKPNLSGEKHWNWKGGKTPENLKIRRSLEYKLWRTAVFERDNFTCVWCGSNKSGTLEADYIKPFCDYPELRFAIDNGRTLCVSCHKKTDTWGARVRKWRPSLPK